MREAIIITSSLHSISRHLHALIECNNLKHERSRVPAPCATVYWQAGNLSSTCMLESLFSFIKYNKTVNDWRIPFTRYHGQDPEQSLREMIKKNITHSRSLIVRSHVILWGSWSSWCAPTLDTSSLNNVFSSPGLVLWPAVASDTSSGVEPDRVFRCCSSSASRFGLFCTSWHAFLLRTDVKSGYFSYYRHPVTSKQSGHSLGFLLNTQDCPSLVVVGFFLSFFAAVCVLMIVVCVCENSQHFPSQTSLSAPKFIAIQFKITGKHFHSVLMLKSNRIHHFPPSRNDFFEPTRAVNTHGGRGTWKCHSLTHPINAYSCQSRESTWWPSAPKPSPNPNRQTVAALPADDCVTRQAYYTHYFLARLFIPLSDLCFAGYTGVNLIGEDPDIRCTESQAEVICICCLKHNSTQIQTSIRVMTSVWPFRTPSRWSDLEESVSNVRMTFRPWSGAVCQVSTPSAPSSLSSPHGLFEMKRSL